MVERIVKRQKTFTDHVQDLKDIEIKIETDLGEFIMIMKQLLPQSLLELKTIKDFETNYKMAKGTSRIKNTAIVETFIDTINKLRTSFTEAFSQLYIRLLQIH